MLTFWLLKTNRLDYFNMHTDLWCNKSETSLIARKNIEHAFVLIKEMLILKCVREAKKNQRFFFCLLALRVCGYIQRFSLINLPVLKAFVLRIF